MIVLKVFLGVMASSNLFFIFRQLKEAGVEGFSLAMAALVVMALSIIVFLCSVFFKKFLSWRDMATNSYVAISSITFMMAQGFLIVQKNFILGTSLIAFAAIGLAIFLVWARTTTAYPIDKRG